MGDIRAAVLGCGGMGRTHMKAIRALDEVTLVAIADVREETLRAAAADAPGAALYTSARQLLDEVRPQLVAVVTNGPSHAELTIAAAEQGAAWVMCEKPMATSLRDARQMIDVCAEHGCRLAINHTRRWSPATQRVRDALADGIIGEPRAYLYSLGAGRLGCNASHIVDETRMLSGAEVVDVTGWLDRTGTPNMRGPQYYDPGGHAVMHLSNGARLYIEQMEDLGVPPSITIVGSIGMARIEDGRHHFEFRARRPEDRGRSLLDYGCPIVDVPFDVSDCPDLSRWHEVQESAYRNLLSEQPILCSGEDGYRAIEAILAIHLSDQRGHCPQALPLTGDDLDFRVDFT